jgi:uncharacterized protein YecE (DUF72 family)
MEMRKWSVDGSPSMNIFVGTAGFSYKDWEGTVYPKDLKKRKIHQLEYLAQFFNCCEINTSFTATSNPKRENNGEQLVSAVNPRFQFTAKTQSSFHPLTASGCSIHLLPLRPKRRAHCFENTEEEFPAMPLLANAALPLEFSHAHLSPL